MKLKSGLSLVLIGYLLGAIGTTWWSSRQHAEQAADVIAMVWGGGVYGKAFYGAQVYVVPVDSRYSVRAQIRIGGHGSNLFQDCGTLGMENSFQDAVEKWGRIEWQPDGLHIGRYFVPQSQVERHR